MTTQDEAQEVLPFSMSWNTANDFAPHILPADVETPQVLDQVDTAPHFDTARPMVTMPEGSGPKDSSALESVTSPESPTPPTPSEF